MKFQQFIHRKWNYSALAFLLPVIGILFVMLISGYAPFGTASILYSDMYHQYYPFFLDFRRALLSGDSLLYNWSIGLGMDYLGLASYYLASPLNLLSVLVPDGLVLEYFSLLMPIKLGLASLFFSILLKRVFQKDDLSITLFGTLYALCAWALGYQWNIMWLDTFALLPLVVLGMLSLLSDRKFVLYTLTLFLSIYTNYYVGLFTCIFIFLLFFCYQICRWQGFKKFFADLLCIALFSALAIAMTAILELPTLAALQTTHSSVNKFPTSFQLNITDDDTWKGLLDAMRQVAGNMNGGLEPTFKEGLPNLYCSIGANIFAFLFLTCKQVKLRDKLCCVFLLLFFNVSFIIRQLDYIWHGFHFTNMIPYRFSFLYSFVVLYMAYRAYLLREQFRFWQIVVAGVLATGLAFCVNDLKDPVYWAYNAVFLLLYLSVLVYTYLPQKKSTSTDDEESADTTADDTQSKHRTAAWLLAGIIVLEMILNLVNFGLSFSGSYISNYPKGTEDAASIIRYMKERESDNLFYRAEVTHTQTLNDGALNNYNGISTFTSSANVKVTEFMKALGYGAKNSYNRYCYEESSPVANLFLGIKYMIERDGKVEENAYFDEVHSFGKVHLLENNAYLPLGFLANAQLVNTELSQNGNRFTFQNDLLCAATGTSADVWKLLLGNCLTISSNNDILTAQQQTGYCSYDTTGWTDSTIVYRYDITEEGFLCFHLDQSKRNKLSVWKNGVELYNETYSLPQMFAVSDVVPGDVVEIKLTCATNETGKINISTAVLNEERFRQCYDILSASTLELTTFENTYVSGTINCDRSGVLYTSIPQNGNWTATVDGKPAEIVLIGGAMVGVLLSEGYHTVSFSYHNSAFSLGWKITAACFIIFAGLYIAVYQPFKRRKKGKYER